MVIFKWLHQEGFKTKVIESFFQISLSMKSGSGSQTYQYSCPDLGDTGINFMYNAEI